MSLGNLHYFTGLNNKHTIQTQQNHNMNHQHENYKIYQQQFTTNRQQQTGLSPLSPGQKTQFLALYAGFTLALNILRPARFALSMAISPVFERIRNFFQRRFGVGPKAATVLMVVVINLMGTCSLMACGVGLASLLSGVPVFGAR